MGVGVGVVVSFKAQAQACACIARPATKLNKLSVVVLRERKRSSKQVKLLSEPDCKKIIVRCKVTQE